MMFAYLNTEGHVLGVSTVERTLAEAQMKLPDVTTIVSGAPSGLRYVGSNGDFHCLRLGEDGTDISHYDVVEYIAHLKQPRLVEIDTRTRELSFETPFLHGGKPIVLGAISHMLVASVPIRTSHAAQVFPLSLPAADGSELVLSDSGELESFLATMQVTMTTIAQGGQALRQQILSATTKAELDAVVDNR